MPTKPKSFHWSDLASVEFRSVDPERTIVILPIAAVEQHGPHLPVSTDCSIAEGMLDAVRARLPEDIRVLFLPLQSIGKSNEHIFSPGTLTLSAETLTRVLVEIGESVHRAGLRKMVIANSHGGNVAILGVVARELRVQFGMLAVVTHWGSFGLPDGVYSDVESQHGIHGGDIETSLMLEFRPDLVRMEKAANFASAAIEIERTFKRLTADGSHAFGWVAQDLHPDGAIGDASIATAAKGAATAAHQADGFIELLRDVRDFSLSRLYRPDVASSA